MWAICLVFLLNLNSFAASTDPKAKAKIEKKAEEKPESQKTDLEKSVQPVLEPVTAALSETRERRSNGRFFVYGSYSFLDLIIPSKYGATLGWIQHGDQTWELEYLRGSVSVPFLIEDLGKMTDQRISLIGRSYYGGNSFNFNYGISYFDFSTVLGDKLLNRVTGGSYPSMDLLDIQAWGVNIGIGNRWVFERNLSFSVDWVSLAQPLIVTRRSAPYLNSATNQSDKDAVERGLTLMSYMPRLVLLKAQFGFVF